MCVLLAGTWPCALLGLLFICASQTPAAASSGAAAGPAEWQVLNRTNFSSQIRLHPHALLVVTMPWYGESKSLMAEIKQLTVSDKDELGRLKLMVVYRNSEKLLTDAIGATEGIKFVYYQHSMAFKYHGKLRARDVLSSVRYIMSLKPELAPFEILHTKEDVEAFMESTDKSALLYEPCGWFTRLANRGSNHSDEDTSLKNRTENVYISGKTVIRDSDGPLELFIEDEVLTFGGGGQLTGSPWKGGFTLANESFSDNIENTNNGNNKSCTVQKIHQFESFYERLTVIAREYFLPPEIVRFGLITERSLLPSLDVVNEVNPSLETWFLAIHYLGCTTCSVIFKEGDDLRSLLHRHDLNIKEVDVDESGGQVIFPASRPSAILFIDRLSHSSNIRYESKLSLKLLRQYVENNYPFNVSNGAGSTSRMRSKAVPSFMKTGISNAHSETARLSASASKLMGLGDKMSVMVVNDGESISYGSSSQGSGGNQLYDILTNLLQKTRPGHRSMKTRIRLVSKNAGLNLPSDDSKIKVIEALSVQKSQHEKNDDSFAPSDNDDIAEVLVDENKASETEYIDDEQAPSILEKSPATDPDIHDNEPEPNVTEMEDRSKSEASDINSGIHKEVSYDVYSSSEAGGILNKQKEEPDKKKMHSNEEEQGSPNEQDDGLSVFGAKFRIIEDIIYEDSTFNPDEGSKDSESKFPPHSTCSSSSSLVRDDKGYTEEVTSTVPTNRFAGSFYFSDGGYRLLRTLTGESRIPSLVIIDPVQQKHYVFPEENGFSYASLHNYFDSFVNQSLPSYHHAASSAIRSKELPRPPFVNHDFHEANSIPQLTTNSFCPLVYGFKDCDLKNEVLPSNTESITSGWNKDVLVLFSNSWCGFCQRAELVVRELHRSFMSFTSYSDSSFADLRIKDRNEEYIMKGFPAIYMIDCTSNECHHLLKSAGLEELYPTLLLFPAENKSAITYEGGMSVANLIDFLESHVSIFRHLLKYEGYLWKKMATHHDTLKEIQFHIDGKSRSNVGYDPPSHSDVVMGSILTATEKLDTAVPFDNARVLIVSADLQEGFIGLIMNKQLSWGIFKNLDRSMEPIKQAPLSYGGPVVVQGHHLVSLSKVALEGYIQVIPGVFYGNIIATSRVIALIKSGEQSAEEFWFFLGYSGWGYSQLFDELSDGAWYVSDKPIEYLDWPAS